MRGLALFAAMSSIICIPAHAAEDRGDAWNARSGVFVGARVNISLGARTPSKPRAMLAVAMEQSARMSNGRTVTRRGEGIGLAVVSERPTFMLAGLPASTAFQKQGKDNNGKQLGISTTALVGIGVGIVVVGVVAVTQLTCVGKDKDFCGSD